MIGMWIWLDWKLSGGADEVMRKPTSSWSSSHVVSQDVHKNIIWGTMISIVKLSGMEDVLLLLSSYYPDFVGSRSSSVFTFVTVYTHFFKQYVQDLTFTGLCIVIYFYNKSQWVAQFLKFILIKNSICFRQIYCPSVGVSTLYTQQ